METPKRADGSAPRLLVVDDEPAVVDLLRDALGFAGYEIATASSGSDALKQAIEQEPDLVVLDVHLPDVDGFEVCRRLREQGRTTPVVFLTARDDASDLRAGFTKGGDDYVAKPFSLEELSFRIAAVLKRTLKSDDNERLVCGDLTMDVDQHRVWRGDEEIDLSPTEFRLLRYLLHNKGRVLSKGQILDHVWQYDFGGDGQVVETYMSYLRRKVDAGEPKLLKTVRGVGYTIRAE